MAKRIAIVGGGSYGWTPTIVRDIVVTKELEGSQIVLEDISKPAVSLTARAARRIIAQSRKKFTLKATTNEREALKGADFVILTISRRTSSSPRSTASTSPWGTPSARAAWGGLSGTSPSC